MINYSEQYKDPRWQKLRLKIFERDKWTCQVCEATEKNLQTHHKYYIENKYIWEYPEEAFITLCEDCHSIEKENKVIYNSTLTPFLNNLFTEQEIKIIDISIKIANGFGMSLTSEQDMELFKKRYIGKIRKLLNK